MLEVRPLAPDDWPLLKALRLSALADSPEAFCTTPAQARSWTDAEWQTRAQRFALLPPASAFAASVDGQPCGLITCYLADSESNGGPESGGDPVGDLNAFWVDPAHRGRGVGEALVAAVWEWAAAQEVREVQAWVMEDGYQALGFYKKVGFRETGERRSLAPGSPRHIVLLTRRIAGGAGTL